MHYIDSFVAAVPDAQRDAAHPKIESDPRTRPDVNPMPFDVKRMIYRGFQRVLDA